ncbi:MAG TPA: threonine/serine exporter family protein, partial [Thermoanaerobaculia bacterium]|nr:threonine/serine exporter family protein [Thermoanaerobaculia bacterium]
LITLVPGLSLTLAMSELSTRDLSSGSARLANALMIFFTLAFGVAFGAQVASLVLGGTPLSAVPIPLPAWTEIMALVVAPLGFVVLLRASPRDAPWILIAGLTAYLGVRLGARALGPQLGAFVGAVAVGAGSNLYARFLDRPAAITQVPGILFLVPGSIGFKSLAALLESDVVSGIETAFRMTLVAIALVAGLLVANVVVPPRKAL